MALSVTNGENPELKVPLGQDMPNIIFIVLDDLGFADLGCYGSEISTPNIDRLAAGGLRYTNFHTTAMCSPSRASLLTGRQHHAVGMGAIAEWSTEQPGYNGYISSSAATIAEVLQQKRYSTYAVGKWHIMPQADAGPTGPFNNWPLGKGFDRWYGFHGALADSWHPELYEDNHAIDVVVPEGYHLSRDLVEHAKIFLDDWATRGEKSQPFFLYLAFGAPHWPHQVPAEYRDRYRGKYDIGWDEVRRLRLDRQKYLGIVPQDTRLPPRNKGVEAWDDLDSDRKLLFARMQEVYSGFVEHTDAQIGLLLDYLKALDHLDNTIIVFLSDNGASPEGGFEGAVNARKELVYGAEDLEAKLAMIDELGGERTNNHYPRGWAQVSNTPLKWYKKDVHGGGVRDPLIIHWPAKIRDSGSLRHQYCHVTDIVPTLMDLLDTTFPEEVKGVKQMPLHGTSFAYSVWDATAPNRKKVQYYEMLGDRGLWRDGWKAVALHEKGTPFEEDEWELYHLDSDFSEYENLATVYPELLEDLINVWWQEAETHQVLPLDDRDYERAAEGIARYSIDKNRYGAGSSRLDRYHVPNIDGRPYEVKASIDVVDESTKPEGVLISVGSRFGGLVLYMQNNMLKFEYSYDGVERQIVERSCQLHLGSNNVGFRFNPNRNGGGEVTLSVNGESGPIMKIPRTWPVAGLAGGLHCGRDGGSPVSDNYLCPFTFNGFLSHVDINVDGEVKIDISAETRRSLNEE